MALGWIEACVSKGYEVVNKHVILTAQEAAKGWLQYSDVIWMATAAAYAAAKINNHYMPKYQVSPEDATQAVFLVSSAYNIFRGIIHAGSIEGEFRSIMAQRNIRAILWTNACAVTFYLGRYFGNIKFDTLTQRVTALVAMFLSLLCFEYARFSQHATRK